MYLECNRLIKLKFILIMNDWCLISYQSTDFIIGACRVFIRFVFKQTISTRGKFDVSYTNSYSILCKKNERKIQPSNFCNSSLLTPMGSCVTNMGRVKPISSACEIKSLSQIAPLRHSPVGN